MYGSESQSKVANAFLAVIKQDNKYSQPCFDSPIPHFGQRKNIISHPHPSFTKSEKSPRSPCCQGLARTQCDTFIGENVQQRDEFEPVASAIVCAESEEAKLAGRHDRG